MGAGGRPSRTGVCLPPGECLTKFIQTECHRGSSCRLNWRRRPRRLGNAGSRRRRCNLLPSHQTTRHLGQCMCVCVCVFVVCKLPTFVASSLSFFVSLFSFVPSFVFPPLPLIPASSWWSGRGAGLKIGQICALRPQAAVPIVLYEQHKHKHKLTQTNKQNTNFGIKFGAGQSVMQESQIVIVIESKEHTGTGNARQLCCL